MGELNEEIPPHIMQVGRGSKLPRWDSPGAQAQAHQAPQEGPEHTCSWMLLSSPEHFLQPEAVGYTESSPPDQQVEVHPGNNPRGCREGQSEGRISPARVRFLG